MLAMKTYFVETGISLSLSRAARRLAPFSHRVGSEINRGQLAR
jgi:hypothetical protein